MKRTTRDLILARHASALPELDARRRALLAPRVTRIQSVGTVLRELYWPVRRVWLGLGIAWALLLVLNFTLIPCKPQRPAQRETIAALANYHANTESILRETDAAR